MIVTGASTGMGAATARDMARAAAARRPRTRYTIGAMATFLIRASRFLPDRVLDRMTTSDLRKHYPAGSDRATAGHVS